MAARRSQSAAATPSQPGHEVAKDATRIAGQPAGLGTEMLSVWTDAAQHALGDVPELSAQATREGTRQLTEWQ